MSTEGYSYRLCIADIVVVYQISLGGGMHLILVNCSNCLQDREDHFRSANQTGAPCQLQYPFNGLTTVMACLNKIWDPEMMIPTEG